MSNLPMVIPASSSLERLAVPRGLMAAMAPYRLAAPLSAAFDQVDDDELRDLVRTNRFGDLWTSWHADGDPVDLWRYADQAASYLQQLPALADVTAARDVVRADIDTEPPIQTRVDMVCTMLDSWNITATPTYIQLLASKLGNSSRRRTETHERTRPWFPLAAVAAAIDEVIETMKPQRGRPVDIADILDIAGRHSSELIRLDKALETMGRAIPVLGRITQAVAEVPRPPRRQRAHWPADNSDVPF